ncbi:MAG TPA: hypothetical protein VI564_01630 [Candidatus Nanoarchaeia archaeon]|nr:hypothetical protein [Candidatus Nanoarchaeia archaeon]
MTSIRPKYTKEIDLDYVVSQLSEADALKHNMIKVFLGMHEYMRHKTLCTDANTSTTRPFYSSSPTYDSFKENGLTKDSILIEYSAEFMAKRTKKSPELRDAKNLKLKLSSLDTPLHNLEKRLNRFVRKVCENTDGNLHELTLRFR